MTKAAAIARRAPPVKKSEVLETVTGSRKQKAAAKEPPKFTEAPRYRYLETSHVNDMLVGPKEPARADGTPGDEADYDGIPGPHMEPLNEAAEAMVAHYNPQYNDPLNALTIVGPGATVLKPVHGG